MNVYEVVQKISAGEVAGWALAGLIILLSLIQISPLRLNPWDRFFGWIGKKVNGGVKEQLDSLQVQVQDLWISSHRQTILAFARECRMDISHNSEEWSNVLNLCEEYEKFTEKNEIRNGVVRENTRFIRELFQELSREHRI